MAKRRKRRVEEDPLAGLEDLLGLSSRQVQGIASLFVSGLQAIAGPRREALNQLRQFGTHFARNALGKWRDDLGRQRCVMGGCEGEAVLLCMACLKPVCLAHIHMSHRAEGICDQCVRQVLQAHGRPCGAPGWGGQTRAPGELEIRQALRKLGLTKSATLEEIHKAHRKLAAQFHPDRGTTDQERAELEAKAKDINAAYEMLRTSYERKAS